MARKPFERAIIYSAVLGGLSLDEVNALLHDGSPTAKPVPQGTYDIMRRTYFGPMVRGIGTVPSDSQNPFGQSIFRPSTISGLDKETEGE